MGTKKKKRISELGRRVVRFRELYTTTEQGDINAHVIGYMEQDETWHTTMRLKCT